MLNSASKSCCWVVKGHKWLCKLLISCDLFSFRRQKRWWNAYLLFYERLDILSQPNRDTLHPHGSNRLPAAIRYSVQKENLHFLHTRIQFSTEFFQFIKKLTLTSFMQNQLANKVKFLFCHLRESIQEQIKQSLWKTAFKTIEVIRSL